jgi:hypothetical protein
MPKRSYRSAFYGVEVTNRLDVKCFLGLVLGFLARSFDDGRHDVTNVTELALERRRQLLR